MKAAESKTPEQRLLRTVGENVTFRSQDVGRHGISRTSLKRLHDQGVVERVGRGLYRVASSDISEYQSFIEASKRVPKSVVCLLSAPEIP